MGARRQLVVRAFPVAVAVLLPILPFDLPDPVAVRWDLGGEPNGSAPRWAARPPPPCGVVWWMYVRGGRRPTAARTAFFVGGVLATVQVTVVVANHGAPSWREAREVSALFLPLPIAVGVLTAWLASRLMPDGRSETEAAPAASAPLRPRERSVWVGTASNPAGLALAAGIPLIAAAPLLPDLVDGGLAMPVILAGLLLPVLLLGVPALLFATVRVVVGPEAVSVGPGPWGLAGAPVRHRRRRRGRGPRCRPARLRRLGLAARPAGLGRGRAPWSALVLHLADGARFTVTVDGAARAAAVVNAYRTMGERPWNAADYRSGRCAAGRPTCGFVLWLALSAAE